MSSPVRVLSAKFEDLAAIGLKQLVSEGLLVESEPSGRETSGAYSLTGLGRSRIEQRKRKEED